MRFNSEFKGLNADLNIIYQFLALLGAHPIFHVCRIRVKAMKIFVIFFLNSGGYYNYPERIIKKPSPQDERCVHDNRSYVLLKSANGTPYP